MFEQLIQIAQEQFLPMFIMIFDRYAIAASLIALAVWMLKKTRFKSRQIQKRTATFADFRREFMASVGAVMVFVLLNLGVSWGFSLGIFPPYLGTPTAWSIAGYIVALVIGHDAWFYWSHRAMHSPLLFKHVHRFHHRSITPTAWTAYSFSLYESVIEFLYIPLWLLIIPTPISAMMLFIIVQILRNTMQHAGLELHPRGWASHPLLRWISTTTHHDMHHAGSFDHNFGFYFTFWDKVMGTEHPDYVATFDRVTGKSLTGQS